MKIISIVAPNGSRIADGIKTIEVRSWLPDLSPDEDLLVVENKNFLKEEDAFDPDGLAVAIVRVSGVRPFEQSDVQAACATRFAKGYYSWDLTHTRKIKKPFPVVARRGLYTENLLKGVLFDLDGTLANTEVLKARALTNAVSNFGGVVSPEVYADVMGQSWGVVTNYFFEKANLKIDIEKFKIVFKENYLKLIDSELQVETEAIEFVNFLKNRNLKIGLVSSASPWMVEKVLSKLDLNNFFDVVITNVETPRHKPDPEPYLLAIEKLNLFCKEVVAFEDSEAGFEAAGAADILVYGRIHNFNQKHCFEKCKARFSSFNECFDWDIFNKEKQNASEL